MSAMVTQNTIAYARPHTAISRNQEPVQAVLLMKGFKKDDKSGNFKTIDEARNHYSSVSKLAYCNYGDPKKIMATLDDDRRLELRRSHFKIGKEREPMISHT